MIEKDAIKAVSSKFVDRWKHLLSIEEWDIQFRYTNLEDGTIGECSVEPAHKAAVILIDISKHKNKNQLLDTIRHELIHIAHAHFESYRSSISKYLLPSVADVADDIFFIGAEDVVLKIEHLLKKLNINVKGYQA
jgi:hypothetical protein